MLLSDSEIAKKVFEATDGLDLLDLLKENPVDLILMDIEMPRMNGIEATKRIMEQHPEIRVIALSMYGHENYYTEMIAAGAKGFLLKNSGFEDVCQAIREVVQGNTFFSPEILDAIIRNLNRKSRSVSQDLTEREHEILYHICKGLSNQEIGDLLFISKRTVDKHRENLLLKTGSKNTAGLVMYAIRNGIVEV